MDDDSKVSGEMMIWMKKGKVDSLELPWFTDAMPNELPRTDQLLFEA
ncbi:hypothetical protein [Curtobacterium sp. PhB78]|nr:hypothetical protein [Curtobacterium sp. PhB78]